MKKIIEDISLRDGTFNIRWSAESPRDAEVEEVTKRFRFELCRKQTWLDELPLDHWWMDIGSVYGQRNRTARNQTAIIDVWWSLCWKFAAVIHEQVQESYILAYLLPFARGNGSRRVLTDAIPTRTKKLKADKGTVAADLEELLRESQGKEFDLKAFRDSTANAIGPPLYDNSVRECYDKLAKELLGHGCEALQRDQTTGLETALGVWKGWMKSIGRHRGNKTEKDVLDILSYECRAALHRCYSQVWDHLSCYLAEKYGFSRECLIFHRFWHLDQMMESDFGDRANFHLFHGHVFALHPAASNFMLTETGRQLLERWLVDPHSTKTYQQLLHGLAVAVHHYALRNGMYAELRKKQPDSFADLDFSGAGQESVRTKRRRKAVRRDTDAI